MGKFTISNFQIEGRNYDLVISGTDIPNSILPESKKAQEIQELASQVFQRVIRDQKMTSIDQAITLQLTQEGTVVVVGKDQTYQKNHPIAQSANKINKLVHSESADFFLANEVNKSLPVIKLEPYTPGGGNSSRKRPPKTKRHRRSAPSRKNSRRARQTPKKNN